jgi:polyphosphate glucokinase
MTDPTAEQSNEGPHTLVIDVGGSGLKATVLDPTGRPEHDRVRVKTPYPCWPERLVAELAGLVAPLPPYQRVSVGFPGVVRGGRVVTAPNLERAGGPGTEVDLELVAAWSGFDLAGAVSRALGAPTRVANDADVQGAGVVSGEGLELVLTLGTGMGSSVYRNGNLALHLELAHQPSASGPSYDEHLGDAARRRVGTKRWNRRLAKALVAFDVLVIPDAILLGGGNAERVDLDGLRARLPQLGAKVRLVGNDGGLLGGIRLWEGDGLE